MKHIKLPSQNKLKKLFSYDISTGNLIRNITINNRSRKGQIVSYRDTEGYLSVSIDRQAYRVHRIIYKWWYGEFDATKQIDHIDRIKDNNRIANLRLVTPHQNSQNRGVSSKNTTGTTGVDLHHGKWRSRICVKGKRIELGYFQDYEDAVEVRKEAEKRLIKF